METKSITKINEENEIVSLQKQKMRALFDGGLVPKGCSEKEVFARIVAGAEIGMKPLQSLNGIAMINGKPSLHSDSIPCVVMASGLVTGMKHKFDEENGVLSCTFYCRRKGIEEWQEWTYSMEDAKQAGLLENHTWRKHPKKMLFNRARSWAFRNTFPDVIGNIYSKEEMEEIKDDTIEIPLKVVDDSNADEEYAPMELDTPVKLDEEPELFA